MKKIKFKIIQAMLRTLAKYSSAKQSTLVNAF